MANFIGAIVILCVAVGVAVMVALVCTAVSMHRETSETVPRGASPDLARSEQWTEGYRFARNVLESRGLQGCEMTARYADHLARVAPSDYWREKAEAVAAQLRQKVQA